MTSLENTRCPELAPVRVDAVSPGPIDIPFAAGATVRVDGGGVIA